MSETPRCNGTKPSVKDDVILSCRQLLVIGGSACQELIHYLLDNFTHPWCRGDQRCIFAPLSPGALVKRRPEILLSTLVRIFLVLDRGRCLKVMASITEDGGDPLIAALPPATDYLTYLTLLEYQLTPQNLPTLNRLLVQDDGKLVQEIGWDLINLVLPMLDDAPTEAKECLAAIARRGNPREVVVRIAEILERLDEDVEAQLDAAESSEDEDALRTFPGEAEPIHLGNLTLEGVPETATTQGHSYDDAEANDEEEGVQNRHGHQALVFASLLDMLGVLHPRIKTQYPSRFLATSLPATLRAYRRLTDKLEPTREFLTLLGKLSGAERPRLPPRASTASVDRTVQTETALAIAPAPDPEANGDDTESNNTSETERSIIQRLLQAVLLEVLEEFTTSMQSSEFSTLCWAVRLREVMQPRRSVPGKMTETERWQTTDYLKRRDGLNLQFISLAQRLKFDLDQIFDSEVIRPGCEDPTDSNEATEQPESPSEFPRSPSDIPYSQSGLILLFVAQKFNDILQPTSDIPVALPSFQDTATLYLRFSDDSSEPQSLPLTDALLSLLFLTLSRPSDLPDPVLAPPKSIELVTQLLLTSGSCPDPLLRDGAHGIAHQIFHKHLPPDAKIFLIRSFLMEEPQTNPALTATLVGWIKDEFVAFWVAETPGNEETTRDSGGSVGLDPTAVLTSDPGLADLLFPRLDHQEDLEPVLAPAIASLNLYCLLRTRVPDLPLPPGARAMVDTLSTTTLSRPPAADPLWVALEDALTRAEAMT